MQDSDLTENFDNEFGDKSLRSEGIETYPEAVEGRKEKRAPSSRSPGEVEV